MELTTQEIEQAATLLCNHSEQNWTDLTDDQKAGFRLIVTQLADSIAAPRSVEAVKVFMVWMGEATD